MVTKTGSGVIVVSAKKAERKNRISVLNTNQLAGNGTFSHSPNFDFLSGEVPSPLSLARWLPALLPFLGFQTIPSLCLSDGAPCHDSDTSKRSACQSKKLQPCLKWPQGAEIIGVKCETLSRDKCWSVTAVLKDCLSTALTNCRMHKERENETKIRRQKTAGGGGWKCK